MKIAFIVEFPTQFEVPFYQYIHRWIKEQQNKNIPDENWDFHVIYNYTDQQDYLDAELGKKIGWGFNLYKGYTFFIADTSAIVNSIESILDREHYDFVILNGYKNSYKGLPELCKSKNIPIGLRIDSVLYNLSPFQKLLKRIYLPFVYKQFDHFFAVGSETRKYLRWLGISDDKISYFSYATDDEWFALHARDLNKVESIKEKWNLKTEKVILSVAKFVDRESPWDILHAFKLLNRSDISLVLVGDGEERKELEKFAAANPQLNITFTGYVLYTELPYYYGLADIFIHAAKNEPWGVSVQEALASGCTVITSDKVGSAKDLIDNGKNGFVYQYQNIKDLKDKITQSIEIDISTKQLYTKQKLNHWGYESMWKKIKSVVNFSMETIH